MSDLASLGLRIESIEAELAQRRLDDMAKSADRAERATDGLSAGSAKANSAIASLLASVDRTTREMLELQRAHQQATGAATSQTAATAALAQEEAAVASAASRMTAEIKQASTAGMFFGSTFKGVQTSMGGAAAAMRDWNSAVAGMKTPPAVGGALPGLPSAPRATDSLPEASKGLPAVRKEMRLTAAEGLNLTRQLSDIGVTAAMGMNPFMIALQQGPQLFDIMQAAAIRSGTTIRATMAATARSVYAAMAPVLPILAAIGAAAAVMGAGIGLATRAASKEVGDLTKGLNLSQEQMKRLKDEGVSTTVTLGDVFRGVGTTIKEVFVSTFGDQLKWVSDRWTDFLDLAWKGAVAATKAIGTAFLGTFYAVRDTWKLLPAALGDAAITAANLVIRAVEGMINMGVRALNGLIVRANQVADKIPGVDAFLPQLNEVRLAQIGNQYTGAINRLFSGIGSSYGRAAGEVGPAVDRAAQAVVDNIEASGRARVRKAAGDAGRGSGGSGSGTADAVREAEKLREVLQDFERIDLRPLETFAPDLVDPLKLVADELALINDLANETARGLSSAFGESGRAMGDLLTSLTSYQSRLAEIDLAEREYRLSAAQADRERAHANIQSYGDMTAAARSFFQEGSDGYRILQAAEQGWRLFQLAMSVQAIAQDAAETSTSIANSAARGTAAAASGAARMFEALGPLGFPAVAAMLALLAGLGLSRGGSKGGASAAVETSLDTADTYTRQDEAARTSFASTVAQSVKVEIGVNDDRFNASVREATAPDIARAATGVYQTAAQTIPAQQARSSRQQLGRGIG